MKKLLLALFVLCIGIVGMSHMRDNDEKGITKNSIIEEKLKSYIESEFSEWYYCDEIKGNKYFFDFVYFPYKKNWEYLVSFGLWWYYKTELGNITSCGWWGELLILKDDWETISFVHRFDEFRERNLPKDIIKLLKTKERKSTVYEQAKKYFKIDENKKISQKCPKNLCNKIWYHSIEDWKDNKTNDDVFVYSTTPPKEMESAWKWWTLKFDENHNIIENDRSCWGMENDWRCPNIAKWKIINKNTISYPLIWDPNRENRIELREVTKDVFKFVHLYD